MLLHTLILSDYRYVLRIIPVIFVPFVLAFSLFLFPMLNVKNISFNINNYSCCRNGFLYICKVLTM